MMDGQRKKRSTIIKACERIKFFGAKWRRHSLHISRPPSCVSSAHNLSTESEATGAKTRRQKRPHHRRERSDFWPARGLFRESHTTQMRVAASAVATDTRCESAILLHAWVTRMQIWQMYSERVADFLFVTSANVTKWKSVGACGLVNGVKSCFG